MSNYTTFPPGAHDNDSLFNEYAWNVGGAYRDQAMELIDACRHLSQAANAPHQDNDLRRVLRACDLALRSAADSGRRVTDEARQRFNEATQVLSRYSERWHPSRDGHPSFLEEIAGKIKLQDRLMMTHDFSKRSAGLTPTSPLLEFGDYCGPMMSTNFVLLRSPFASARDPGNVIVRQTLSANPSVSEILWNFNRFEGHARITLEQNPHFYSSLPRDEHDFTPSFNLSPIEDFGNQWRHLPIIYVLVDRPGRVFLESKLVNRSFGNVWMMNDSLIFKDRRGLLEAGELVRRSIVSSKLWYCEQQIPFPDPALHVQSDHRCLRPIVTTPLITPSSGRPFEDWSILSHPKSRSIHIHIYDAEGVRHPGSEVMDLPPPPPTSERPRYHPLYTGIESIVDDILLGIFNCYRLDEGSWNHRLGWCRLSQVCRRWRDLIYKFASHLGMHILCTNGTPLVDTLDHLPTLPLVIDYQDASETMSIKDQLGVSRALQLRDRVLRVVFSLPPAALKMLLLLMDDSFPALEYLCLSSTVKDEDAGLIFPTTFEAPNIHHLTLLGIGLPKGLPLLSSTFDLVTLTLADIQPSGYFIPQHLVARLRFLPQLEELSIGFSIPIPRPSAEDELLGTLENTPVTLPVLKRLTFRGVSSYLECLLAQIHAPLLDHLDIALFNQPTFTLPHLSRFTNATEVLKLPVVSVIFGYDAVSVVTNQHGQQRPDGPPSSSFRVMCRRFEWQVACASQICNALRPALSRAEALTLDFDGQRTPTDWEDGTGVGLGTWRALLRPFVAVRKLRVCHALAWEISFALLPGEAGLDPMLLPALRELAPQLEAEQVHHAFSAFVDARLVMGRPVHVSPSPVPRAQPVFFWSNTIPPKRIWRRVRSPI